MPKINTIIIGAGVIGCSIAYQLAKRGQQVLVLERDDVGSHASSAAAGILGAQAEFAASSPLLDLALASREMFPELTAELKALSGIDIELIQQGLLKVATSKHEADELQSLSVFHQQRSVHSARWLTVEQTRQLEPALSEGIHGAIHFPEDGQVSAPRLTEAFAKAAALHGARFKVSGQVEKLIVEDGQVTGVLTKEGPISCDHIVVAAGVWSSNLLHTMGLELPLFPVKGECFSVKTSRPLVHRTIYTDDCYLVPKMGGELLVGATVQENNWDRTMTVDGLHSLLQRAIHLAPALQLQEFHRTWTGLRPKAPHALPYIGEHPSCRGLFLATGHYRNGILLSPITGLMIADAIEGSELHPLAAAFTIPNVPKVEAYDVSFVQNSK